LKLFVLAHITESSSKHRKKTKVYARRQCAMAASASSAEPLIEESAHGCMNPEIPLTNILLTRNCRQLVFWYRSIVGLALPGILLASKLTLQ
jgi:hypothetical protein